MVNKDNKIGLALLLSLSIGISLAGCGTEQTKSDQNLESMVEQQQQQQQQEKDILDEVENLDNPDNPDKADKADTLYKTDQTVKPASPDTTNDVIVNKNIQDANLQKQESNTTNTNNTTSEKNANIAKNATNTPNKIEGREELLARLDNLQKELDALPEKKDSDAGVTNAMRSYYGRSYEMYDKALNEIYTLLKDQLPSETMKSLQTGQIKWIEQKEATANQEASQYKGGTFEFVANYISLYESTKQRCYELVNMYMTD